jgi:CheY-like chemotaxis protein
MHQFEYKPKILVAEDDFSILTILASVLKNYHLIIACKAVTAIEIINNFDPDIDGVVCDFNFRGESLTGHDVYKAIKAKYPAKPFFLFSSAALDTQNIFGALNDFTIDKFNGFQRLKSTLDCYFLKNYSTEN